MKAIIKAVTASKEFNQDQLQILRRVALVLIEHDLSVDLKIKVKETKSLNLKAS